MSGPKSKASNTTRCTTTRGGAATIVSKLAKMVTASSDVNNTPGLVNEALYTLSRSQLVSELENQRASLWKDMSALNQEVIKPLHTSVYALLQTVNNFNIHLAAAESMAGENVESLSITEKIVKLLQAQNNSLQDHLNP